MLSVSNESSYVKRSMNCGVGYKKTNQCWRDDSEQFNAVSDEDEPVDGIGG